MKSIYTSTFRAVQTIFRRYRTMAAQCLIILLITMSASAELVLRNVSQGMLQGELMKTSTFGGQYYSFKGIPYAAPPVGSLRFKAPQPPLSWDGVRNATSHGASCPQIDILTQTVFPGSEDCLFLNVYSPNITACLPVMFFIHGGLFKSGSGNDSTSGPEFLVHHDVVVVTINYRLEVLGFMCMETEEVPGNAGLKDQAAALLWVQRNIRSFGGDPDNVTIFGHGSGGASVLFHMLSKKSKGLFKRAIVMSGSPLDSFTVPFRVRDRAFELAKQTGLSTNDTAAALAHLQNVSVDLLYNTSCTIAASEEISNILIKTIPFVPVVEKDFGNDSSFLTRKAIDILREGDFSDVDLIIGSTSSESVTLIQVFNSTYMKLYDRYPELFAPLRTLIKLPPNDFLDLGKNIKTHYFGNETVDGSVIEQFVNYVNEANFVYDVDNTANIISEKTNRSLFMYKFTMSSGMNFYGNLGIPFGITGKAAHYDDTMYLFNTDYVNLTPANTTEYALVKKFCTLFTNFAKYGHPTPDDSMGVNWPLYNTTAKNYLDIGNNLTIVSDPDAKLFSYWEGIYGSYGQSFY